MITRDKRGPRDKRHYRLRRWVRGTAARPRLAVFRSSRHIYAQVIDDVAGRTLAAASTAETELRSGKTGTVDAAKAVGKLRKDLKVPHTLPDLIKGLEMDKKRKALIADMAVVDPTAGGNPGKLTKKAALTLLEDAMVGTV